MPELPEVETVVRTLEYRIKGRRITDVDIRMPKIIEGDPEVFAETLKGQSFREFGRRGKYLLFYMDDCVLVSHLRMEGKYYIQKPDEPFDRHVHVFFRLDDVNCRAVNTQLFEKGRLSAFSDRSHDTVEINEQLRSVSRSVIAGRVLFRIHTFPVSLFKVKLVHIRGFPLCAGSEILQILQERILVTAFNNSGIRLILFCSRVQQRQRSLCL